MSEKICEGGEPLKEKEGLVVNRLRGSYLRLKSRTDDNVLRMERVCGTERVGERWKDMMVERNLRRMKVEERGECFGAEK